MTPHHVPPLGVLVSGRGENLRSLLLAKLPVKVVISNVPNARALSIAAQHDVPHHHADTPEETHDILIQHNVRLVCCAGYMRILPPFFIKKWRGRALNIHPSLLPAYRGLHPLRRALTNGAAIVGASVHHLTDDVDGGPLVAQVAVRVMPDDNEASLARRVLNAERRLYPYAVRLLSSPTPPKRPSLPNALFSP